MTVVAPWIADGSSRLKIAIRSLRDLGPCIGRRFGIAPVDPIAAAGTPLGPGGLDVASEAGTAAAVQVAKAAIRSASAAMASVVAGAQSPFRRRAHIRASPGTEADSGCVARRAGCQRRRSTSPFGSRRRSAEKIKFHAVGSRHGFAKTGRLNWRRPPTPNGNCRIGKSIPLPAIRAPCPPTFRWRHFHPAEARARPHRAAPAWQAGCRAGLPA